MADSWTCPVIGIDMGDRHSSVGVWQHGRVEIIMNDQGNRKIPFCVAFTEKECLIGDAAKNQMATNPENTIFGINKLIGKSYSDARFQKEIKNRPFKVIADADDKDKPKIVVTYKGEERQFTAEEIYSMVLIEMKKIAEAYLGAKVKHAVITVPPYFYDTHRKLTIEAGAMAGLDIIKVIKEPRAAVIAYAFHKKFTLNSLNNYNALIFNLGGGNLDVTLLTVNGNVITFKGVTGHYMLGGDDFDKRMASNFIEEYKCSYGHGPSPFDDPRCYEVLVAACERAKRRLSINAETQLDFDFGGTHFSATISRTKFELLNRILFKKCLSIVDNILGAAKMKENNISRVILAGGSTRIPKVRQMLHEVFPEAELCCGIVDEVYAYGGAIHAAMASDVNISRVVPSSKRPHGAAAEERLLLPCKKRRRDLETNGEEVEPSTILQDIETLLEELSKPKANSDDVSLLSSFPKDQFLKLLEEIQCKPNDLKLTRKVPRMLKNLYPVLPKNLVGVIKSLERSLLSSQQKFMKWSSKEDAIPVKLGDADAIESSLINIKTQLVQKTSSRDNLKANIAGIEIEIAKLEERKAQLKEDLGFAEQDLMKVSCSMGPQLELAKLQSAQLVELREASDEKAEAKDSMESTLHIFATSFMKL